MPLRLLPWSPEYGSGIEAEAEPYDDDSAIEVDTSVECPWQRCARLPTRRPRYRSSTACAAWTRTRSTTSPMAPLHSGCSARTRSARSAARLPLLGAGRRRGRRRSAASRSCLPAGRRGAARSRDRGRRLAAALSRTGSRRPPAHRATSLMHSRTRCSPRKRGSPRRSPRMRARSRSWTARCGCAPSASAWRATSSASSTGTSMRVNSRSCPISPWASGRRCSASPRGRGRQPRTPRSIRLVPAHRRPRTARPRPRGHRASRGAGGAAARRGGAARRPVRGWRCRGSPPRRCATPRAPQNLTPVGALESLLTRRLGDREWVRRLIASALRAAPEPLEPAPPGEVLLPLNGAGGARW